MLWVPLPDNVTVVDQAPPDKVAVPICVVVPLKVSNSTTVPPAVASVVVTAPEIVSVDWLVEPPRLLIVTVGGAVSTEMAWVAVVAALPAASDTLALIE